MEIIKYRFNETIKYPMFLEVLFNPVLGCENFNSGWSVACNEEMFEEFIEECDFEWGMPATIKLRFHVTGITKTKAKFITAFSERMLKYYGISAGIKVSVTERDKFTFQGRNILYPWLMYFIFKTVRQGLVVINDNKKVPLNKLIQLASAPEFGKIFIQPSRIYYPRKPQINDFHLSASLKKTHIVALKKHIKSLTKTQRDIFHLSSEGLFKDLADANILKWGAR